MQKSRNSFEENGFLFSPVTDFTVFTGFSCLSPSDTDRDLDDFIRNDAERHSLDKIAITYALCIEDNPFDPIGFVTLQNDAIVINSSKDLPEVTSYPYKAFPAVKIGRLGIRYDLQGNRFGTLMLSIVKEMMVTENRTGCRFITVDARRDKKNKINVTKFYAKNGFSLLPARPKTSSYIPMYFDLANI